MKLSECYRLLNASPEMEWHEVKKSYHSLAKRFHPDILPEGPNRGDRFRKINQAYKILEALYRRGSHNNANDPVTASQTPEPPSQGEAVPTAKPCEAAEARPLRPDSQPAAQPGWIGRALTRLRDAAFRFERKYLLLDVKHRVTLSPRLAATGCSVRIRKGRERFQVRIPRGPWNRLFLRVPGKGNFSVLSFKRGDLLLEILVADNGEVATRDSRFFYSITVPRRYVRWGKTLTLQSARGPIRFTLPKTAEDGQEFAIETVPDSAEDPPAEHIVRVQLV